MKATYVRDLSGFTGVAKLYKVAPPAEYGYEEETSETEYLVVSKVNNGWAHETYIFPGDETGKIINFGELDGSARGEHSHEEVLQDAGYEVE